MSVFDIPEVVLTDSTRHFDIPPTILSDYRNQLHSDVPNTVFDFRLLRNWYDQFENKEEIMIRAEHFPINWKSKVGNSDANKNFYTDYDVEIKKGDIVIREDGLILMLNWSTQQYINAQTTQAIECNNYITVTRHVDAKADKRGFKYEDAFDEIIVDKLPCVMSEYAGRPDYQVSQNTPGVHADMLTIASMQYNDRTSKIKIGDEFDWGTFRYRVINLNLAEVNINRTHGVLVLNAKRVAGEEHWNSI